MAQVENKSADYVIIGNSVAAIAAVEAIRKADSAGSIIMVTREPKMTYSRPLISYYLAGKVGLRAMRYRNNSFHRENKVELLAETEVVEVSPKRNCIKLGDGSVIGYGRLLITTGGEPITPTIEGFDTKGVFNFTTFKDAEDVKQFIKYNEVENAVILGAGLIGLKAAEALLALEKKITIVELADRILSATFDTNASEIIEKALAKQGCSLMPTDTIKKITSKNGRVSAVELFSGKKLNCDIVVIAIGVRPNIELVKDCGIELNRGIVVDDFMRTNFENIYAAGDVAEAGDFFGEGKMVLAIWPDAYRQGAIAGAAMTGGESCYQGGIAMNAVELAGVPTISVGATGLDKDQEGVEVLERCDLRSSIYRKIVLKDGVIQGVILVGKIDRAGIYTGLIKDKVNTETFKDVLLSEDFGIISLPKEYRKYIVSDTPMML